MRTSLIAMTVAVTAACGSTDKPRRPVAPTATVSPSTQQAGRADRKAQPRRVAIARGDLRDALLALRRVQFAFDTADLTPDARAALAQAADKLARHSDVSLFVDGHTDERGTTEYNIGLGERRARAVADYLTRLGIAPERLQVISFGREQPRVAGRDEATWAANRRVEFRLVRGAVRLVLEDSPLLSDSGAPLRVSSRE